MNIDSSNRQNLYSTSQIMPPNYSIYTIPTTTSTPVNLVQTGSSSGAGRGGFCGKIACIIICIIAGILIVAAAATGIVLGVVLTSKHTAKTRSL
jgi:hypothetical protein